MYRPKTVICDIDGTLIEHCGDIIDQCKNVMKPLNNSLALIKQWESLGYKIILITGRKECTREETIKQLREIGVLYDEIIFGATNGDRVLINDKKPNSTRNTAYAVNVNRNQGIKNLDLTSELVVVNDDQTYSFKEKPWGSETLIECNDKYVVKELFMKQGECCSLQYHELKRETVYILSGCIKLEIGTDRNNLTSKIMMPGDSITIEPMTIHRMEGVLDSKYLEASTNELWDVVRLDDKYNRDVK